MTKAKLTPKQARFVEEYLVDERSKTGGLQNGWLRNATAPKAPSPNARRAILGGAYGDTIWRSWVGYPRMKLFLRRGQPNIEFVQTAFVPSTDFKHGPAYSLW